MSLLEQNTIRKELVDDKNVVELDANDENGEYKVEAIQDSAVYTKKTNRQLLKLYYLVA